LRLAGSGSASTSRSVKIAGVLVRLSPTAWSWLDDPVSKIVPLAGCGSDVNAKPGCIVGLCSPVQDVRLALEPPIKKCLGPNAFSILASVSGFWARRGFPARPAGERIKDITVSGFARCYQYVLSLAAAAVQ
jgi:hypothetical protein